MKNSRGITIIALIVTIIIMLILVSTTIGTINSSLINKAENLDSMTKASDEIEIIHEAITQVLYNQRNGILTSELLQEELEYKIGEGETTSVTSGTSIIVTFINSGREYEVNSIDRTVTER